MTEAGLTRCAPLLGALALAGSGCVRAYQPPKADEPHATLEVQRVYETQQGKSLREVFSLDGHQALTSGCRSQDALTPRRDVLLIHPRPAMLALASTFFHGETRAVQESYMVQVPYQATESYGCGDYKNYRTCTRSVTRYRSETKYRTVMKTVEVPDGSCERAFRLAPVEGHLYVVKLTYLTPKACRLDCVDGKGPGEPSSCPLAPEEK